MDIKVCGGGGTLGFNFNLSLHKVRGGKFLRFTEKCVCGRGEASFQNQHTNTSVINLQTN